MIGASQVALVVKNLPANAGDMRHRFDPWAGKVPWTSSWQPTLVFLPRESHGQKSLTGYSPRVTKNWTWLEQLSTHACNYMIKIGIWDEKAYLYITPFFQRLNLNILNIWEIWSLFGTLPWLGEDNGQNKIERPCAKRYSTRNVLLDCFPKGC